MFHSLTIIFTLIFALIQTASSQFTANYLTSYKYGQNGANTGTFVQWDNAGDRVAVVSDGDSVYKVAVLDATNNFALIGSVLDTAGVYSVALSGDGLSLAFVEPGANLVLYKESGGVWSKQGAISADYTGAQGTSISMDSTGNTIAVPVCQFTGLNNQGILVATWTGSAWTTDFLAAPMPNNPEFGFPLVMNAQATWIVAVDSNNGGMYTYQFVTGSGWSLRGSGQMNFTPSWMLLDAYGSQMLAGQSNNGGSIMPIYWCGVLVLVDWPTHLDSCDHYHRRRRWSGLRYLGQHQLRRHEACHRRNLQRRRRLSRFALSLYVLFQYICSAFYR